MRTGDRVLTYVVERELGEGGMGSVYLARHTVLNQQVAIKVLSPLLSRDHSVRERFIQEANIQAALRHPGIVQVLNAGYEGEQPVLVMEYIEGNSLFEVLERRGALPIDDALRIMEQVFSAVGYAHQQGVIHRDLKPENIMVTAVGDVKVTDFGIAKILGSARLTRTGTVMGSAYYMSPEQIMNPESVDTRSDIYSLGCLFYELLTGRPPFGEKHVSGTDNDFRVKSAHVNDTVPTLKTEIPSWLTQVVMGMLEKDSRNRPSSCELILEILNQKKDIELESKDIPAFLPYVGDVKDFEVIELLCKPGDIVKIEQSLITVECEKFSMEIPAPHGGMVKELKVNIGDKVSEGSLIAILSHIEQDLQVEILEKKSQAAIVENRSPIEGQFFKKNVSKVNADIKDLYEVDIYAPSFDFNLISKLSIFQWHKKIGDYINEGETVVDIETDEFIIELPAPCQGTLVNILKTGGSNIFSGDILGRIRTVDSVKIEQWIPPKNYLSPQPKEKFLWSDPGKRKIKIKFELLLFLSFVFLVVLFFFGSKIIVLGQRAANLIEMFIPADKPIPEVIAEQAEQLALKIEAGNPNNLVPCPKNQDVQFHNCWGTSSIGYAKYVGEYRADKETRGTLAFSSGAKYVGQFKNDNRHGLGVFTYADGATYVGEFQNDMWHGQGIYTYADGSRVSGLFENGKFGNKEISQTEESFVSPGKHKMEIYHGGIRYAGILNASQNGDGSWTVTGNSGADSNFIALKGTMIQWLEPNVFNEFEFTGKILINNKKLSRPILHTGEMTLIKKRGEVYFQSDLGQCVQRGEPRSADGSYCIRFGEGSSFRFYP